jgi:AcrR family transcriptional regulator
VHKGRTADLRSRDTRHRNPASGVESTPPVDTSRERIQASALRLFARYGYDGVSLQMIADDVGLHKSSLFHHYGSKLELMSEAVEAVIRELLGLLAPLLNEEAPKLETLCETTRQLVDHLSDHPQSARLLVTIMTAPDDSEVGRLAQNDLSVSFYIRLAHWLERARHAGVVRVTSIRQAIPNFMGVVLFYPAVANDLRELVGPDAFSARARHVRKEEITRLVRAMFTP